MTASVHYHFHWLLAMRVLRVANALNFGAIYPNLRVLGGVLVGFQVSGVLDLCGFRIPGCRVVVTFLFGV